MVVVVVVVDGEEGCGHPYILQYLPDTCTYWVFPTCHSLVEPTPVIGIPLVSHHLVPVT